MIDLDVSERACDDLIEHGLGYLPPAGIGNSVSIKEIIARLRQAEKDAARYRWLRDLPGGSAHEEIGNYPGDMWDESIDEAMQCNK